MNTYIDDIEQVNGMENRKKIFISKSTKDDFLANAICDALESLSFECWIAPRNIKPGEIWTKEIMKGIRGCDVFLSLMTLDSDDSPHCEREIGIADSFSKKLMGIKVGEYEVNETYRYYLKSLQMISISDNPTESEIKKAVDEIYYALEGKHLTNEELVINTSKKSLIKRDTKTPIKHNLPIKPNMIGRIPEYQRALLSINEESQVLNISGMAGIGKKTLANAIGHYYVDNDIYDMLIWLNAENRSLRLSDIIDQMALISGDKYLIRMDDKEKELAALALLQDKSCVFIINGFDRIDDEDPINFIKQINFDDAVIITSEKPISSFDSIERVQLQGLSPDETKKLALMEASRIGLPGLENAPMKVFQDLRRYTSGNPQAIKMSIGQIKSGASIDHVIAGLSMAKSRVFEDIYSRSWSLLSEQSKEVLYAMTTFSGSASFEALLYVCDMDQWDFSEEIQELTNASLLETNNAYASSLLRFSTLTLTENYVKSKAKKHPDYQRYVERFIEYFSGFLKNNKDNFGNIIKELDNIRKLTTVLKDKDPIRFSETLRTSYAFLRDTGFWDEAIDLYKSAIKLNLESEDVNTKELIPSLRTQLSSFYLRLGSDQDLEQAKHHLSLALEAYQDNQDMAGETRVRGRLGRIALKEGRFEEALELSTRALEIANEINLEDIIPDIEHEIGDEYFKLGKYDLAEKMYLSSLEKYKARGNEIREIGRYNDLGKLNLFLKEYHKSENYLKKSIEMASDHQKLDTLCRAKIALAELYFDTLRYSDAEVMLNEGLDLANRLKAHKETAKAESLQKKILDHKQDQNGN